MKHLVKLVEKFAKIVKFHEDKFYYFFFFFKESGDEFKNNRTKTRLLSYPRVITFDYYSSFKSTVTRVLGVATYPREVTIHPGVNTGVTRPCASFAPRYDSCELQDRTDRRYKYRAVIGWDIKEISNVSYEF